MWGLLGVQLVKLLAQCACTGAAQVLSSWKFVHNSCAQLSPVPCRSPAELQPVLQRAPHIPCSQAGLNSGHPGAAEGSGCTPRPSAGSLFRTGYSPPSGKPFELLNWSCLLLFDGCDAWSVSSVKGLLKYKVLMKSCLVGEQYRLTRLLKKSCLKDQSTSSRSFQGLGVASVLLWHRAEWFEIQRGGRGGNCHPML